MTAVLALTFLAFFTCAACFVTAAVRGWRAHGRDLHWSKPPTRGWFIAGIVSFAISAASIALYLTAG
jgi:hypothetical protein